MKIKLLCYLFVLPIMLSSFIEKANSTAARLTSLDTSKVFYYSFRNDKAMYFKKEVNIDKSEKIEICQGTSILLEAPKQNGAYHYVWNGPNGFISYQPKIYIENANPSQSGEYVVKIKLENQTVSGNLDLVINASPTAKFNVFKTKETLNLIAQENNSRFLYEWKDLNNKLISTDKVLKFESKNSIPDKITLEVTNKSCKSKNQFDNLK